MCSFYNSVDRKWISHSFCYLHFHHWHNIGTTLNFNGGNMECGLKSIMCKQTFSSFVWQILIVTERCLKRRNPTQELKENSTKTGVTVSIIQTSMHFSRMRTTRLLPVSHSMHCGGVCFLGGVCFPGGRVSASLGGGGVSQHVNRMTDKQV